MVCKIFIGDLIGEHRIIERMGRLLEKVLVDYAESGKMHEAFLADAVDFFMGYTDAMHHGKEEKIIFEALKPKKVRLDDKMLVDEIILQHTSAQMKINRLENLASEPLETENEEDVFALFKELVDLYTIHIEMEDTFFRGSLQGYFDDDEKTKLDEKIKEFELEIDTQRYERIVSDWESKLRV